MFMLEFMPKFFLKKPSLISFDFIVSFIEKDLPLLLSRVLFYNVSVTLSCLLLNLFVRESKLNKMSKSM